MVSIDIAGEQLIFDGVGARDFPTGDHILVYRAKGKAGTAFSITADGAQMKPIERTIPPDRSSTGGTWPIRI